ncbi:MULTISPECIES: non-ribosomal peptide synthetase [Mycetohabitans]|uniref:non-ribosomal peptide synthetase n=1 Tax=Mycetohabitans TaxID=2571159 RepID=UPI001F3064B3|nr:non-ribosomal peptide synthetase [Mycetohabitans sp. B3]MCF2133805.1 amino acid adenylation domain-containing protein [Mycetohabitans sp. B3]
MDASVTPVTYALSTAQTEIWLAQQLHPESPVYNIAQYTVIEGVIEPAVFEATLRQVIDEADTLRLQFVDSDDGLRQRIGAPAWSMPVLDLTSEDDPQAAAQAWMQADYQQPVNLMQGPLFCYALLKVAPAQWMWYQRYHHIMMDGYGRYLIAQRVAHVYSALCAGTAPAACDFGSIRQLLESDAQYQASAQRAQDEAYWLKHCANWPEPVTLASRSAPAFQQRLRQTTYLAIQALGDTASDARRLAQFMTVAMAAYLYRFTGEQDVVLGFLVKARFGADRHIPGMKSNTLPLRFTMRPGMNLSSFMQQAAQAMQSGLRHQCCPSEALRRQLELPPGQRLFGTTVNVMPFGHELSFGGHSSTNHNLLNGPAEDLMLCVYWTPGNHQLRIDFDANPACYTAQALDAHQRRFIRFVQALAADAAQPIDSIDLLDADERHRLLVEWNATKQDYPSHWCVHQLFEAQVERTPEAPALVFEAQTLSYAQLNAQANRLAHQLIELGVKPDTRVAICVQRSPALVVGVLAILKAGGAYVPFDPSYPGERLVHILTDAAPSIVLADADGRAALGDAALAERTVLDPATLPALPDTNPSVAELTARHLAYVIYTSGSTGMPKGVMIEHAQAVNFLHWALQTFTLSETWHTLFATSINFDLSVFECFVPLAQGSTVHLADDALALMHHAQPVSVINTVPSVLQSLLVHRASLASVTTINLAGEPLTARLIKQIFEQTPVKRLCNLYGPSECTTYSTWHSMYRGEPCIESIGRPIANTRIYLLNTHCQPVPLGAVGELYIGGAGVARGYLNRPELTAERFVRDPFVGETDARMYKTGDLARYLPDGNLEFLGRTDDQVKIRGFRIEPGEIEACLTQHPQVREAVVLAQGDGNGKRLVAYVVAEADGHLASTLHTHVSASLPEYMVPSAFVQLDAWPLTPNGKLDRRALPAPDADAFVHQAYEAPQGEFETTLAKIWTELLGIEQVSRHDSFFALGGHSLLAVQLIERLRRRGVGLSVRALFDTPVLMALAQTLGQHREVVVPPNVITPTTTALTPEMLPLIELTQAEIDRVVKQVPGSVANIQDIYALSPLQDGILFHHLLVSDGDPYLLITQLAFDTRARLDQYLDALQQVVNRHDILRTALVWEGLSTPAQVVWRHASLSVTKLAPASVDGPIAEQWARRFDLRHARLDLTQAPLLRLAVAQDTDGRWMLIQLMHHLIGDHSTLEMMHSEVQTFIAGEGRSLPPAQPFRNLVAQARLGVSQAEHERFFTDMLADIDEPTLPFGLVHVHRDGTQVSEAHRLLPQVLNDRMRAHARRLGVCLASLCHLAWAQVLARASGQQRVVFGTVLFGRMHAGSGADSAMGLFINTLPLRVDLDDSVQASVCATHARLAALLEHEHASLALAQRCSGVPAGTPLFSALLNYRHNATDAGRRSLLTGVELLGVQERTNYPLALSVEDDEQTLGLTAQTVQPLEPERVCAYMQQALQSLADALEATPDTPVQQLQMLPEAERQLLFDTWNATQREYPSHRCVHQLFEVQVERTPGAPALEFEAQTLSYAQLNAQANRLAHRLIELGVKPDARVAICAERSPAMVVGLLAILKAGGAYVPIDPAYPSERLAHILADVASNIVLADAAGRTALGEAALAECTVLDLATLPALPDTNPSVAGLTARHLAYVIYTSGSTGTPKGVMVPHHAVARLVINNGFIAIDTDDRVAFAANPAFDASTFEVWAPLLNGGCVVIFDSNTVLNPCLLEEALSRYQVTTLFLTTALFNQLVPVMAPALARLKYLLCGGEKENLGSFAQLLEQAGPSHLIHCYGPTEGTTFSTTFEVTELSDQSERLPIGRPIANTRVYLLDAHNQPVPLGAVGELYIGGAGVACGYLNRPELTAERFVRDPFSREPGARMYRTGDLARYRLDGNLEFLGRNDDQVKVRGFRIEPGEIKACLTQHPQVRDAVMLVTGEGQDKRLVAYVVAEPNEALAGILRAHVATSLPEYMVPSAFVRLDVLPLTPNGKLDRRALPAPDDDALAHQAYEAPQGELECMLAAIWVELLDVERVGRHDSFFALGGHSLLAVRLMNRVAALGMPLPLAALFAAPTLAGLAAVLSSQCTSDSSVSSAITPVSRDRALPLSFAQQRLWFLAQLDGASDAYHIPLALRVRGAINQGAWQQALNALLARHEALRSVFISVDGQPQVQLLPAETGVPMTWHNLRGLPDADTQLARLSARKTQAPFDLACGPLMRACGIQLTDDEHVMLLVQHHIVSDGWSIGVMVRELSALYRAACEGQADPLPPLSIQYPDYAAWQRQWLLGERLQAQSDYWRTKLADAPVLLELPTDRPRPAQQSFAGAQVPIRIDAQTTGALKRVSQAHGATLFMTVLAAWSAVLARLSGQDDLVIGIPSANRNHYQIEPLIGFFVNTLALHVDLSGEPSVTQLLERVRCTTLDAQAYQDLPFEQVVEIVQPPRRLEHTPLFQVMFAWQDSEIAAWDLPGLTVQPMELDYDVAKFDLELGLYEAGEEIVGSLGYATALFDRVTIERHVGYLQAMVQAIAASGQQPVAHVELLAPTERTLLLNTWNATQRDYPAHQCIHPLFEAQAVRTPEAMALVYKDQTLSYTELNAQANRLAHQLIELGVKPDARVALCAQRSPETVVGMLATLKAGGAYVPLDPTYPAERLAYMVADSAPAVLLSVGTPPAAVTQSLGAGVPVLDLHADAAQWAHQSEHNCDTYELSLNAQHLAYVIYTSGSTGQPKGVMVTHHSLVNLVTAMVRSLGLTAQDRMLQCSSLSFDASIGEMFVTLTQGATLVLRTDAWLAGAQSFWALCQANRVSVTDLPTQFWTQLIQEKIPLPNSVRVVMISGDALSASAREAWFAGDGHRPRLLNVYGPTETTITATVHEVTDDESSWRTIGRPIDNIRLYILDAYQQPVPLGAVGELYIGGAGVARGYLNRPELSAERFVRDPFSTEPDARMYKTGDLARYQPNGNLEFLGRNDDQVKIRGFRIEPGEIEACLAQHPQVHDAVVLAQGEGNDKRLIAYVVAEAGESLASVLRAHVASALPEYMVPSAFVRLDAFPLTTNGKLDRRALPAPDAQAFAHQAYEAPQGELETTLAQIWAELLGVEQVGRHDSFFALGGHSLLAVQLIEHLRRRGLSMSVRALFEAPTLSALAQTLGQRRDVVVPPNVITPDTTEITPSMLPLIELTQAEIDHIVKQVPGGITNLQDIYALSPLQDGILFHHLLATEGDPYLLIMQFAFDSRTRLDQYLDAVQQVIHRHDILRTAFVWEGVSTPAQVVCRHAPLLVTELVLETTDGPISEQLARRFDPRHTRMDLAQAPLLHCAVAQDTDGRWLLVQLLHHLIGDHSTAEVMHAEVKAFIEGRGEALSAAQQFRSLVAQVRLGFSQAEHERFFTGMLADIDEPTLPFGLAQVHHDGRQVTEARHKLPSALNDRLRAHAKRLGVSLASLCHLAWAQVLARTSGQQRVVFGTVLFGRTHVGSDADSAMGLFINTLPMRVDLDGSVQACVRDTHRRLAALLEHEHASLALAQRCSGVPGGTPLFSALLNYRHNAMDSNERNTLPGVELLYAEERDNYPIGLSVEDFGQALGLTAQIVKPLDPNRVCAYMQQALQSLAEALEAASEQPVRELEVLPSEERNLLIQTWNATQCGYLPHLCVHQLFEAQVECTPQATALIFEEQTLSYAELNTRANRLAHRLIKLGVKPDTRVAICVERSPAMVVGLLAVLKAGGAYVPLDPSYPSERLTYMVTDSTPTVLLSSGTPSAAVTQGLGNGVPILDLQTDIAQWAHQSAENPNAYELSLDAQDLAYVIYTSGSTGRPKGVMVQHQGVVNLVTAIARELDMTAQDKMLQFAPLSFDTSIEEIFTPLTRGAALVLRTDAWLAGAEPFWSLCAAHHVSVVDLPVQFWTQLVQEAAPVANSVRAILIGGDALSASARDAWFSGEGHRPRLLNAYGPTETTVTATIHEVADNKSSWCTIGRPIDNTRLYILDSHQQSVPLGAVGELYIGGAGVARGYLNRPKLTAERFVRDPFANEPNARMYKTGDLARYLPDGNLEFLGRNDYQVKIRGFRIELGEIEACLAKHAQVHEAVVLAMGESSAKRLVAYVVAKADEQLANTLRTHVASALPEYMVPSAFVRLDAFPLTPNGKLDRRALPEPDDVALAHQVYEAPQGELETTLAAVWAELLDVERVGRHDSFFALGGHSLLAVRLIERLRRRGLSMSVRALFEAPTLSALAQTLGQHCDVAVPANAITPDTTMITPSMLPLIELTQADIDRIVEQVPGSVANIQDIYALSPLQDGILFHHLLATEGDPYLLITQSAFDSRERLDQYLHALQQVIDRHDILRTAFVWEGVSMPAQVVWRHARLPVTELTFDPVDGPIAEQLAQRFDSCHTWLDLTQAPLLHCAIAQDSDGRWLMVQLLHHLIGDHSTDEVMHTEVRAFMAGQGTMLPAAQPFRNLVAHARLSINQASHTRFFTDMLADVSEPTLPFGLTDVYGDNARGTEAHRRLPQALNDRLRAHAKRLSVSLASLCHLAWAQVLARASGQQRVVFGTVLLGRMQADGADWALGLFLNVLPLRVDLDGSVESSIYATHTQLAALLEHEHTPLVRALRCSGVPASLPLFSALLNYRHNILSTDDSKTLAGVQFFGARERSNYPLVLSVEDYGTALGLTVQIVQPGNPDRVCGYMQQVLESLAEALDCMPDQPVQQLKWLPDIEREQLLWTWNATQQAYPAHLCIHQLFEVQVERTPNATALVYEDQMLSYAQLNAQANRLAHQLIELGVKPDERVAICVAPSLAMVVGLLATLKAGGAYVPLDPAYPGARLVHLLHDAAPEIVLADAVGRAALGEAALVSRTVLDPNTLPEQADTNPSVPELTARHLAYVIYTSGSTGTPKGVMVEHRGVMNLVHAQIARFEVHAASRVLQSASFSFDASISEILMAFGSGATLYLPPNTARWDQHELWTYLKSHAITHVTLPSALLQHSQALPILSTPLTLILAGEAPSVALVQHLSQYYTIFNAYGPTEATVCATVWRGGRDMNGNVVPIGQPITNTRIYLLDAHSQLVPLGAVGELYIGGAGVARGYLNRPELTAERFVPDPFSDDAGARLYKTGDVARYRPDGNLEYLGRNDEQVKIRGFRIEPGEIEACLTAHPRVRDAVVLATGEGSAKRLVAYVQAEADEQLASTLRAHVAAILPEYMVPSAFVRLDAFPLTPNGKLDRRALPAPDDEALAHQAYEVPQGELETTLASIWSELLGVEQVGRHDSFFALGGHSLLAVQMISRSRTALGVSIPMHLLFDAPSLAALAQRVSAQGSVPDDSFAVLLPIQSHGSRPPLFCVHPVTGLSWHYRGLTSHLEANQPVYGLQARGLDSVSPLALTIEAMAADYIQQIRLVQPEGPYYLLGWSLGGNVIHSMATQLEQQGERVALLAVLDATPNHTQQDDKPGIIKEKFYINMFARHEAESLSEIGQSLWKKTRAIIRNNERIIQGFSPCIYGGDMLFFRATVPRDTSIEIVSPDVWQPYVLGNIEVNDIVCKHEDMDLPEPTAHIGRILRQKLNELQECRLNDDEGETFLS